MMYDDEALFGEDEAGQSEDEASYVCGACGEDIVVPVDPSGGAEQDYVEDCPVCCRPNRLQVTWFDDGEVRVHAELDL